MAHRYQGASRQRLDDRGRLHVPQRWQPRIAEVGEMVLTAGPMGCLWLLEPDTWDELVAAVEGPSLQSSEQQMLRALLLGHAETVTVDKNNRILVSESQRAYADLLNSNAVFLVGTGREICIWSQDNWDRQIAAAKTNSLLFDQSSHSGSKPVEAPVSIANG